MNLDIMLWMGGMVFSLGIFALKVGLGLRYGRVGTRGIALTLAGYTTLFMVIAVAAGRLMQLLEPLLRRGAYMHTLLATGMIVWGVVIIFRRVRHGEHQTSKCREGSGARLLLIIPCPVCLTAMTFSIWAALNTVRLPPLLTGFCLGSIFAVMALLVALVARPQATGASEASLGMTMIGIGFYFIASLFLPAKIEAAKGMYASFISENRMAPGNDGTGVFIFIFLLVLVGYWAGKNKGSCS